MLTVNLLNHWHYMLTQNLAREKQKELQEKFNSSNKLQKMATIGNLLKTSTDKYAVKYVEDWIKEIKL